MNQNIKEAVYVALVGGAFYCAAKHLKADANAALILGTALGKIFAQPSKKTNYVTIKDYS